MPRLYAQLAAAIASSRVATGLLIVGCLLGLPAAFVFRSTASILLVGLLWYLVLIVVWFRPNAALRGFGPWVYAIFLDLFPILLLAGLFGG